MRQKSLWQILPHCLFRRFEQRSTTSKGTKVFFVWIFLLIQLFYCEWVKFNAAPISYYRTYKSYISHLFHIYFTFISHLFHIYYTFISHLLHIYFTFTTHLFHIYYTFTTHLFYIYFTYITHLSLLELYYT